MVPPPAPIVRSRKLSKSTNAVSFANAPTREVDGKDAIIRHLRSDNERLEKLVVEAVNASEEVATKAVEEQVGGRLDGWRAGVPGEEVDGGSQPRVAVMTASRNRPAACREPAAARPSRCAQS